jgi:hypothetical protein
MSTCSGLAQQQASASSATVPRLVNFSGTALNGQGKAISGIAGVSFAIYKDQSDGAPLWLETQNVTADTKGNYTVQLGATKPEGLPLDLFTSGEARWLGVTVNGGPEQPRILLLSVPYALKAADAETIGGLPPSAFMLAAPAPSISAPTTFADSAALPADAPPATNVTGSGTAGLVPLWTGTSTIGNSVLFQSAVSPFKIGINTTTPTTTLDVKGAGTIRGMLSLPALGTATAAKGSNSQPLAQTASVFNSGTGTAVTQNFRWQAEPVGNNTSSASGSLNLLYGSGSNPPAETGLQISSKGLFTFAAGQTFPGSGSGTVTSVGSGAGLTGGPITSSGTLSVANAGVTNAMLQNPSLTVTASSPLTGGGSVALGGTTSLGLKTCSNNQVLQFLGSSWTCATLAAGTVTSVGFSAPSSDFAVTGSPITTSGTLGLNWTVTPTSAATANAIVKRDASGSFSSGPISAAESNSTAAVTGTDTSVCCSGSGVYGVSANNTGVYGNGGSYGVYGTAGTNGTGVIGYGYTGVSGQGVLYGVAGTGTGTNGTGVSGEGPTGVYGNGYSYGVWGISTTENGIGVYGNSTTSYGVYASGAIYGVIGDGTVYDNTGVYGISGNSTGVSGISGTGPGVYAQSYSGWAVDAVGTGSATGVLAGSSSGYAGWFSGQVEVEGNLSKSSGSFKIDHPLDPANKYLYHSFVESPDMMNIYNGNVTTDAQGDAVVDLPEWFETLNRDFRYQLTVIGQFAQAIVSSKVANHQFMIKTDKPKVEVSWQVTGIRQDAWAKAHRIPVEEEKPEQERGFYLHPELYGAAEEKGVLWARSPQAMKQWKEARAKAAATDGKEAPAMTPPAPQRMRPPGLPMVRPPLAQVSTPVVR